MNMAFRRRNTFFEKRVRLRFMIICFVLFLSPLVYEPEHEENIQITVSGMEGFIEDNYTIVPEYQGKYPIPPVKFTYFNPQTALYKTLDSQDLLVDVFDGPQAGSKRANMVISESKQIIETSENAFRFIKLNTELTPVNKKIFWMSNRFWTLLFTHFYL